MHHFFWNNSWFCGAGRSFYGPWGFMMSLVFWCLVLAALVWVFRTVMRRDHTLGASWEETLKKRYAAGEINREEFEQIKGTLR